MLRFGRLGQAALHLADDVLAQLMQQRFRGELDGLFQRPVMQAVFQGEVNTSAAFDGRELKVPVIGDTVEGAPGKPLRRKHLGNLDIEVQRLPGDTHFP
ncbi:hypothetical protein VRRI112168_17255 [Vreelandella rituensis]